MAQQQRGTLKIFLGYAVGVGTTTAMLTAAREKQRSGITVVVACVQPPSPPDTLALLDGLTQIPPIAWDASAHALNLEAVLAYQPALVVVDELAHTNPPGSRHAKRYLDVEEMLAAGLNVYATLTIQHLESLNDIVTQITGITITETLPDRILDQADTIEVIDLSPAELMTRYQAGQIGAHITNANHFYRLGNLNALRELTLRRVAQHVDAQMREYMQDRAIAGPWPATERLLVCVSPSPLSARLVRSSHRLAKRLDAAWFALYVETPEHTRLTPAARNRVIDTLHLAESLGAKAVTLPGNTIAEGVAEYARRQNITQIVAGKPLLPRWTELVYGSIVDQIIRQNHGADVHIIHGDALHEPHPPWPPLAPQISWRRYLSSALLVAIASGIGELIRPFLEPTNLVMLYLLVVVVAAVYLGRGPAIMAAITSVLVFDIFFVPPRLTLLVHDAQYLLTFMGLLGVGLVISTMAARAHEQAQAAHQREAQTMASYELSQDLATAITVDTITEVVAAHVGQTFESEIIILLPQAQSLHIQQKSPRARIDDYELEVAQWVFTRGQPAGHQTSTHPTATSLFWPLQTAHTVVGVLGIQPKITGWILVPEQRRLLASFASQAALAIERARLAEEAAQTHVLRAKEQLQTALLNSISHDLRTPLASITGALSSLRDDEIVLSPPARRDLIETAYEQSDRLNRLVGNLLDMTRLEAGAMQIRPTPSDVQDVIGVALSQFRERLGPRPIELEIEERLPLVPIDFVLIVQVLTNLLDNALKYSPPDSPITLRAYQQHPHVFIEVADRGIGIPTEALDLIFDKFYRVPRADGSAGTGLGLSISQGILEAHAGHIHAQQRAGGGTIFCIQLPVETSHTATAPLLTRVKGGEPKDE